MSAIPEAGTLHRDLKPSTILLDAQLRARVSDLGLAIPFKAGVSNKEAVGTPGYIAPEIHFDIAADGGASPQSDLYSLACIAFELLTGYAPYVADDDLCWPFCTARRRCLSPARSARTCRRHSTGSCRKPWPKIPKSAPPSVELFRRALLEARNDSLEPVRILVAEDDPDFRELLEIALTDEFPGADIECVANGRKAVEAFDRKPASVVVLDFQMPEIDGMGVTALLRSRANASRYRSSS